MAQDDVKATEGISVDRRQAVSDEPERDHLEYLDEELADAEQRVKDAQAHRDEIKKQKRERA
jgi:hypothetical protein